MAKRVCMLGYTGYENDGRVVRYAQALVGRGDEVDVIAVAEQPNLPKREGIDGVVVHRIQERVINEKSQFDYAVRLVLFFLRSGIFLSRSHLRRNYDAVHVHNMPDFLVFAAWLPRLMRKRIIHDIHDLVPELYANKFGGAQDSFAYRSQRWIEKLAAAFADHVIVSNDLWHDVITERSVSADRCSTLINYVDSEIFAAPSVPKPPVNQFTLLYPGSLQKHQGLDVAICAFAQISIEFPTAEFHIYGEGPEKPALRELVRELKLERCIKIHPAIARHKVPKLMAEADIGIVPKRADSFGNEAYSTKVMEFMSQGTPVIISNTDVDRYYFDDGLVRFFESGDVNSLASAIREVLLDPEQRKAMAQKGLTFAAENSWESHQSRYFDIIDGVE